jgi:hypothetical protein
LIGDSIGFSLRDVNEKGTEYHDTENIDSLCHRCNDICCGKGTHSEMSQGQHSNLGTIFFTVGFTVMFALM